MFNKKTSYEVNVQGINFWRKKINVDNTDYVSLVEVNDPSNFKLLEKFTRDGELVLREVIDEIKLEKVKLQALKKFAGIIKDVQLNRLGGNEKNE